jgi:hypothetical protein
VKCRKPDNGNCKCDECEFERKNGRQPPHFDMKLWACADCGCTDVQVMVWTHANNPTTTYGEVEHGEAYFCPQCEDAKSRLDEVDKPKPFKPTIDTERHK